MSKVLYFDCFSGISGDMLLGALIDAGLPFELLKRALGSLAVAGYEISTERVLRAGVSATKFVAREHPARSTSTPHEHDGHTHEHKHDEHKHEHEHKHSHRSLPEIFALIDGSALTVTGRERAKALFRRLAEVEAAIHQMPIEQVHLHEVGALDSIIDIVGAVFGLEWFGADTIVCSPLNVGGGMVDSAHGVFPVPAPATVALLGGAPIYGGTVQQELVTPTGALIVSAYAASFGPIPPMSIDRAGYGAGDRDFPSTPNVLRILVGRAADPAQTDRVSVIECEIDDMNPQIFGVAMDRLYEAGALEVFYVSVQMKKNRPGTLLTVLAPPARRSAIADVVFRDTTTIGLRHYDVARECLRRETVTVDTAVGPVRFKIAWRDDRVINASPEFEDCVGLAAASGRPVKDVQALAVEAYGHLRTLGTRFVGEPIVSRFFLTTAIDYVNSSPHLGTAYEKIMADVIARYKRLSGIDTHFLMGNDEHSQNVFRKATEEGLPPLAYCDRMEREFRDTWRHLNISFDDFIRTTEPRHKAGVDTLAKRIYDAGDIYEGVYEGWYCVGCEGFKQEKDLVDGRCPLHLTTPQWISEKNYFFRLAKYQQAILDHFNAHPEFLQPEARRNEVLRLVEGGLDDISVSRAGQAWGIPLPFDPSRVVYVWFDALIDYASAVGLGSDDAMFERWWPADLHVIGKDITRFHAVIWPAMLMSAGVALPCQVFGHGFMTFNGQRMSKSLGTTVDPLMAASRFGPDPLRLYLVKEIAFGGDGDFSWGRFDERYNVDCANNLGNLVSRVTAMAERYRHGRLVPTGPGSERLIGLGEQVASDYRRAMDGLALNEGAAAVFRLIDGANEFIAEEAPWALAKDPAAADRLTQVLFDAAEAIRLAAVLLVPIMPTASAEILRRIGGPGDPLRLDRDGRWRAEGERALVQEGPLWARKEQTTLTDHTTPPQTGDPAPGTDDSAPGTGHPTPGTGQSVGPAARARIAMDDFMKVELRVAKVLAAERVPKSRKLIKLHVDVGTEQRTLVAGIAEAYEAEALIGRSVVIVFNLQPATLMGIESNGMVLAASPDGGKPTLVSLRRPRRRGLGFGDTFSRSRIGQVVIDSHCHLADVVFAADLEAVVHRARAGGVEGALVILAADDEKEAAQAATLEWLWPDVRVSIGVHPHRAHQFTADPARAAASVRAQLASTPSARAVGEVGLDYHYDFSPREVQQAVFRLQVRLARELGFPVIVHTREADEDTISILRDEGDGEVAGVLHCFTGTPELARSALELGFYLSVAGIVTFPKAGELRETLKAVPLDRLLTETDSPYLAPVPYRGKRNEPANVARVVDALAGLRGLPPSVVAAQTMANFHALFRP